MNFDWLLLAALLCAAVDSLVMVRTIDEGRYAVATGAAIALGLAVAAVVIRINQ